MSARGIASAAVLATSGLLLAACGSSSSFAESAAARAALRADVTHVQYAAAAHQRGPAIAALNHLRTDVARFQASGNVGPGTAAAVLSAASAVQSQLHLIAAPATTTTTSSSTTTTTAAPPPTTHPAPPPPPPDHHGKPGKGN